MITQKYELSRHWHQESAIGDKKQSMLSKDGVVPVGTQLFLFSYKSRSNSRKSLIQCLYFDRLKSKVLSAQPSGHIQS